MRNGVLRLGILGGQDRPRRHHPGGRTRRRGRGGGGRHPGRREGCSGARARPRRRGLRRLRIPSRECADRRGLRAAPQLHARRVDDEGAGGRKARPLREAFLARRRWSPADGRDGEGEEPRAHGRLHVPVPPSDVPARGDPEVGGHRGDPTRRRGVRAPPRRPRTYGG